MESGWNCDRENTERRGEIMHIGLAADHGGFELKTQLAADLKTAGYEVTDFGAHELNTEDGKGGKQR